MKFAVTVTKALRRAGLRSEIKRSCVWAWAASKSDVVAALAADELDGAFRVVEKAPGLFVIA